MTWRFYELTKGVFVASTDRKNKISFIKPIIMTQVASDPDIKRCRLYIWDPCFGDRIPYIDLNYKTYEINKKHAVMHIKKHYCGLDIDRQSIPFEQVP